jgi:5-methyltetrahydrofolate--homocysteine methyltransferase
VRKNSDGTFGLGYVRGGEERTLPVPADIVAGREWAAGKVKHCVVAIRQARQGEGEARALGLDYLQALAEEQEVQGAHYLDVNVDEYTTDAAERAEVMRWVVDVVQRASRLPLSIDSSQTSTLRAGLAACDRARGRPMLNSASLERAEAIGLTAEFDADVIASAAGERTMPRTVEERLAHLRALVARLKGLGRPDDSLFLDPLVFPVATDGRNSRSFIEAVAAARREFGPAVHITGGFSNVSFGLPNRRLINVVFTWLAREAGADSGIVDPAQINGAILDALDTRSEGFRLARALLMNEDEYGAEYIAAAREGRI